VRGPLLAVALAVAVVAALLVVPATRTESRPVATNSKVLRGLNAVVIRPGATRCQDGEFVAAGARFAQVIPRLAPGEGIVPPFALEYRDDRGRPLTRVSVPFSADPDEFLVMPLSAPVERDVWPGRLCVLNRGDVALGLEGDLKSTNREAPPGPQGPYRGPGDEVRADLLGEDGMALTAAGNAAERWSLFRPSFAGPWTLWTVLALFCVVGAVAVRHLLRELRLR